MRLQVDLKLFKMYGQNSRENEIVVKSDGSISDWVAQLIVECCPMHQMVARLIPGGGVCGRKSIHVFLSH